MQKEFIDQKGNQVKIGNIIQFKDAYGHIVIGKYINYNSDHDLGEAYPLIDNGFDAHPDPNWPIEYFKCASANKMIKESEEVQKIKDAIKNIKIVGIQEEYEDMIRNHISSSIREIEKRLAKIAYQRYIE